MATMKDVARLAGVSIATVSAAINGSAFVSAELRARVTAAIHELGYAPDGVARSLKKGRTQLIGLIVADITNPFFTELVHVIEASMQDAGYSVLLCDTDEDFEKERNYLRILQTHRVDGVILGAAGRITAAWSVFANYAFLDSEVLQSVSDFVKESTGMDAQAGNPLANVPEHSGSVWTTYNLADWTFGYGVNYQGSFYLASTDDAPQATSYTMHRAMVGYQLNQGFALQLNVDNLFDKQYFTRIRNNGWATPGAARSVVLTATVRF